MTAMPSREHDQLVVSSVHSRHRAVTGAGNISNFLLAPGGAFISSADDGR